MKVAATRPVQHVHGRASRQVRLRTARAWRFCFNRNAKPMLVLMTCVIMSRNTFSRPLLPSGTQPLYAGAYERFDGLVSKSNAIVVDVNRALGTGICLGR